MARFVRAFGAATAMLLGHSQGVAAQDVAHSFSELRGVVRPDAPITVMDSVFSERKGKLVELTPSTLTLRVDGRLLTFAEADIVRIRQPRRDPLKNGALWGAGVAASVLTVSAILHHEAGTDLSGADWVRSTVVFTAMCTGTGIAIDALNDTDRVVYEKSPRQQTNVYIGSALKGRGATVFVSFRF